MNATNDTLVTTRVFPFHRDRLFAAFADPEILGRWWGPEGFTNTITDFEFQAGGTWKTIMHAPDGNDFPNESRFTSIHPPERIVFEHLGPFHHYEMVMKYEDLAPSESRLTWEMSFDSAEHLSDIRQFLASANEQNFDRLQSTLHASS